MNKKRTTSLLCGININSYRSNTHNAICRLQRLQLQLRMIEFIHHKYLQRYTYDTMMRNIKFHIIIASMLLRSMHTSPIRVVCIWCAYAGASIEYVHLFNVFFDYVRNAIFMHSSASEMWQRFFKYYNQMNPIFHFICMRTLCMNEDGLMLCAVSIFLQLPVCV